MALLKFKRSAVSGKAPALTDLALGELAINTFDGKLYMRKDNGTASIIEVGAASASGVLSFNTRTGAVTLSSGDVTTALGYTPANKAGDTFTGAVNFPNGTKIVANGDVYARRDNGTTGVYYFADGGSKYLYWDGGQYLFGGSLNVAAYQFYGVNNSRAPIFYDSDNTAYYVDAASTSNIYNLNVRGSAVYPANWTARFQSTSDFANGTLVTTDIPATAADGDSFVIEITGKSYDGSNPPFKAIAQGYLYGNGIINFSGINYGGTFSSYIKVFQDGGVLKFWWPRISYWNSFNVNVMTMNDPTDTTITRNRVTAIGNSTEPTGTKKVQINLAGFMRSDISATNSADVRAPIFYDNNDTAYYIDPNTTGTSFRGRGEIFLGPNTSGQYLRVGGNGGASDHSTVSTSNGNLHIDCKAGYELYLNWYSARPVWSEGGAYFPIYYDRTNTGFYLDPASRSNLSNITVASGGTESGIRFRGDTLDFVGRYSNYVSLFNANGPEFKLFDSSYAYLNVYGENAASWRAPIFYDSNDTGRYVDPNSTSNLYRLSSYIAAQDANANWNTGFQNTPAYSYNYHGDLNGGTNAPAAGWWFYESMRHSNASNYWGTQIAWGWEDNANRLLQRNVSGGGFGGWVEYLNTSNRTYNGNLNMTGSIISTSSDVRAPVFYDQNNTAYYIDAASGSNLAGDVVVGAAVYCYNWFRSYGATGWYNQTYGGGVWMNDTTWVRIYNSKAFLVDNQIAATGNITAYYSDERLKTKTGGIDNALAKVLDLDGFTYVENDLARSLGYTNKNQQVGVSAQAVKAVLPEAVALAPVDYETLEDGTIISKSGENYLTVDYSRIVPLLIEAIKELTNKVETLEAHIRSK